MTEPPKWHALANNIAHWLVLPVVSVCLFKALSRSSTGPVQHPELNE